MPPHMGSLHLGWLANSMIPVSTANKFAQKICSHTNTHTEGRAKCSYIRVLRRASNAQVQDNMTHHNTHQRECLGLAAKKNGVGHSHTPTQPGLVLHTPTTWLECDSVSNTQRKDGTKHYDALHQGTKSLWCGGGCGCSLRCGTRSQV